MLLTLLKTFFVHFLSFLLPTLHHLSSCRWTPALPEAGAVLLQEDQAGIEHPVSFFSKFSKSQVKSSHLYLYSAFNNTDCVKALNSIKLEDRVSVMYNNKIKHSIFS